MILNFQIEDWAFISLSHTSGFHYFQSDKGAKFSVPRKSIILGNKAYTEFTNEVLIILTFRETLWGYHYQFLCRYLRVIPMLLPMFAVSQNYSSTSMTICWYISSKTMEHTFGLQMSNLHFNENEVTWSIFLFAYLWLKLPHLKQILPYFLGETFMCGTKYSALLYDALCSFCPALNSWRQKTMKTDIFYFRRAGKNQKETFSFSVSPDDSLERNSSESYICFRHTIWNAGERRLSYFHKILEAVVSCARCASADVHISRERNYCNLRVFVKAT